MPYIFVPEGSIVTVRPRNTSASVHEYFDNQDAIRKYCGGKGIRKICTEYYKDGTHKDIWQDVQL